MIVLSFNHYQDKGTAAAAMQAAMQQLRAIPGTDRLIALRNGHIITVEGQVVNGGIHAIDGLDDMADTLAGFK